LEEKSSRRGKKEIYLRRYTTKKAGVFDQKKIPAIVFKVYFIRANLSLVDGSEPSAVADGLSR
jgi:hypothetical protein